MKMKQMIKGATDEDLADFHFSTWLSCHRGLTLYRSLCVQGRNFETEVYVYQGPTGTGKSREAMEKFPNAYWKQRSNWWDGYCAHEEVIIDEFYGWLPFDLCLRICDRYPLLVETKGGNVQFVAKKSYFLLLMLYLVHGGRMLTSNHLHEELKNGIFFQFGECMFFIIRLMKLVLIFC